MRITRGGFTNEDFYGSNDTDVVHFRWLHKLLRKVPTLVLSDISNAKFAQTVTRGRKRSKYGENTYATTVTTMNADHVESDHVVNPFIDEQLDKFYQDVVKPQIDRLDGEIHRIDGEISTLNGKFDDLHGKYDNLNGELTKAKDRIAALEQQSQTK